MFYVFQVLLLISVFSFLVIAVVFVASLAVNDFLLTMMAKLLTGQRRKRRIVLTFYFFSSMKTQQPSMFVILSAFSGSACVSYH